MSREEYDRRFTTDDDDYCKTAGEFRPRFPLPMDDALIEQALQEDEAERKAAEEEKTGSASKAGA